MLRGCARKGLARAAVLSRGSDWGGPRGLGRLQSDVGIKMPSSGSGTRALPPSCTWPALLLCSGSDEMWGLESACSLQLPAILTKWSCFAAQMEA
eukprot:2575431-Rhodomonas_salina.4